MPTNASTRAGFLPARVIHLHPSRFCNLACRHCYSTSGPEVRDGLEPRAIINALSILRTEGYEVVSLSGGEPLLYSGFEVVVRAASQMGYRVNLISNGSPVGGQTLKVVAECVDLIAISLDGAPNTHDQLRGNAKAFLYTERAVDRLASAGVRFGIAFCVSQKSLTDMLWAAEFAETKGASLIQFHPFAAMGRGRTLADSMSLNESDKARAYVIAALLDTNDRPAIQVDLAPVDVVRTRREDYSILEERDNRRTLLSDLVNPLIVDESGRILPLAYGINPGFSVGQIGPDIDVSISDFKIDGWRSLRALLNASFESLGTHGERFVDWFYHIAETSRSASILNKLKCTN